ncbi:MAG: hypothetical protein M0R80_02380 [Proteobacteria bacterium]|jgi:hypothetical protein|nr:hypothetical protein [Pseudomonadota bacterium]
MNFKEWIISESALSRAEELYLNFIDGDIEFSKLGPVAVRAIERWYEKHQYSFDYDEFKSKVLKRLKKAEDDSIEEVLSLIGAQLERSRIRGGIRLSDEEGFKPEKPEEPVEVPKPIEKPAPIVVPPKPIEIPPKPIEIPPKPIEIPPKPIEIPAPEPIGTLRFKPWQKKFALWPDEPPQRKLF